MIHARPVLTRPQVDNSVSARAFLAGSNLSSDIELVKFTQLPLTLEELSKLWSVFFQTQYTLSVAYQGTVVFIESEEPFTSPLPVQLRNLYVETFRQPLVEEVVAASADDDPILAQSQIRVRGAAPAGRHDAADHQRRERRADARPPTRRSSPPSPRRSRPGPRASRWSTSG